ncbi:alpha/beta hydrolase [Paenibacillus sp. MBLB4367]|uniref:alpha/beta hydrolase n=1 Tax=Paenibacillus sp. MBLB4367 TaxID=3384767 RepID=UPI003907F199
MERTNAEQLAAIKGYLRSTSNHAGKTVEQIRREMTEAAAKLPALPPDMTVKQTAIGALRGEWISIEERRPEDGRKAVLYFHGGGFVSGTCAFYRELAGRIAKASGVEVLTFEYRLAPEHPYPAANADCLNAYRWLLANGYAARNLVLGGDSVGGSLAFMTLLSLRDAGEELPAGAFLLSPHADLAHLDGESYRSRAALDPTGSLEGNQAILAAYLGDWQGEPPAILSPLKMDLSGLPALLIQAGDQEVLLSDATRLAAKAEAAGVEVTLEVWEHMWSVFQLLAYMLPEAQQAIANIGHFVRASLQAGN